MIVSSCCWANSEGFEKLGQLGVAQQGSLEHRGRRNADRLVTTEQPRTTSSGWSARRQRASYLLATSLPLSASDWNVWTPLTAPRIAYWLPLLIIALAVASTTWLLLARSYHRHASAVAERYGLVPGHILAQSSTILLGLLVAIYVACDLLGLPHHDLQLSDGLAAAAVGLANGGYLWDTAAKFPLKGLYAWGFVLDGLALVHRNLSSGRFVVWTGICELTGLLLIAALLGWGWQRFPRLARRLRLANQHDPRSTDWFHWAQATVAALAGLLIGWILLDPAFRDLGADRAFLGLSGHWASCPAALMLVGTTILMAWQSQGRWRGSWQYAAMGAGVLFSTSVGWARISGPLASTWAHRLGYLFISAAMMTLLTRFGLARVLPMSGDWITRARRAAPVFGLAACLLAVVSFLRWMVS